MEMGGALKIGLGAALLLGCVWTVAGQAPESVPPRQDKKTSLSVTAPGASEGLASSGLAPADIFREIDDPHTGARWLLMRNREHPAGPGRLVLVGVAGSSTRNPGPTGAEVLPAPALPVIHAGDTVMVEEKTAVVEAHLEAVALGPAVIGTPLEVRLKIGGRVLRAVALGPGRAAILGETEARQ
jgi:hypothetical protein